MQERQLYSIAIPVISTGIYRFPLKYKGFCSANVEKIRTEAKIDTANFDVIHDPIPDNYGHCNIKMFYKSAKPKKSRKALLYQKLEDCFGLLQAYKPT
jgi:hypothetical protein